MMQLGLTGLGQLGGNVAGRLRLGGDQMVGSMRTGCSLTLTTDN
jgi:6-phosphogluconate dehydrogenase (decarboxylating)